MSGGLCLPNNPTTILLRIEERREAEIEILPPLKVLADVECMVHIALPNQPIKPLKLKFDTISDSSCRWECFLERY